MDMDTTKVVMINAIRFVQQLLNSIDELDNDEVSAADIRALAVDYGLMTSRDLTEAEAADEIAANPDAVPSAMEWIELSPEFADAVALLDAADADQTEDA